MDENLFKKNLNNDDIMRRFEELSIKYQNALDDDIEFEQLKKVFLELKEIKLKLSKLSNK